MSASQPISETEHVQMSHPNRGARVHRTTSLIELALFVVGSIALVALLQPIVN